MKRITQITAILLTVLSATPIFAQTATVEINALSATGVVVGAKVTLGPEFAAKHNVEIPAPFSVIVPNGDDHNLYALPAPGGTGIYKIFFATLDDQTKSNIQFLPMTVDLGPAEDRLDWLRPLVREAFIASVPDVDAARINYTQNTEIGPYPAVEMVGNYTDETFGTVILRVVAIPNPDGEHGIIAIINGIAITLGMTSVEDIMKTDSSRALSTFKFQ